MKGTLKYTCTAPARNS